MHEILLIRDGGCERVVDTLAVAAELVLSLGTDTQVDIAVPESCAEYVFMSSVVRRVIAVPAIDTEHGIEKTKKASIGSTLFSATKKLSALTGRNVQAYWNMSKDLRITEYDAVFDFDFSPFSIAVSKVAKTKQIIGFDVQNIDKTSKISYLSAHETYHIKGEMSNSSRMRHLAARHFSYSPATDGIPLDWCFNTYPAPEMIPQQPYIVVGGRVPAPFMTLVKESNLSVLVLEEQPTMRAEDITGALQSAKIAVGNGVVSALAAAVGIPNLFIGSGKDIPQRAISITTPSALADALPLLVDEGAKNNAENSDVATNAEINPDSAPPRTSDDNDTPPQVATLKLKK